MSNLLREVLVRLPYRQILFAVDRVRKLFRTDWPDHVPAYRLLGANANQIEAHLRESGFEGVPASYKYEGELLNLRKPIGVDDSGQPREVHIRARQSRSTPVAVYDVVGHTEPSRYEAKEAHIHGEQLTHLSSAELAEYVGDVGEEFAGVGQEVGK